MEAAFYNFCTEWFTMVGGRRGPRGHVGFADFITLFTRYCEEGNSFIDRKIINKFCVDARSCAQTWLAVCCEFGTYDVAVRLVCDFGADVHADGDEPFVIACRSGCMKIVKWLLFEIGNINIGALNEGFLIAIANKRSTMARWLYNNCNLYETLIDAHISDDRAFMLACKNGDLRSAQWLYYIVGDIDYRMGNFEALSLACGQGHMDVIGWLLKLDSGENDASGRIDI